jgi:ABC-type branched-subunit amino acid transport system substrate-binding protein
MIRHAVTVAAAALAVATAVAVVPRTTGERPLAALAPTAPPTSQAPGAAAPTRSPEPSRTSPTAPPTEAAARAAGPRSTPPSPVRQAARCAAGANGGATDRGVTASGVRLFSSVVQSGVASATIGVERFGLHAATNAVNRAGGVCGRALELRLADDGAFGLPFAGTVEALRHAVADGFLARTRTPVVTAARTTAAAEPWLFRVGATDAEVARLMVRDAYRRGARTFGVLFDERAAGEAFDAEVHRLTGRHVDGYGSACARHWCGPGGAPDDLAADQPDFVGLLASEDRSAHLLGRVTPSGTPPSPAAYGYGGADQHLGPAFLARCGGYCAHVRAWSSFKARCGYPDDAALQRYERAVAGESPDADPRARPTLTAYAVVEAFADALRRAGPVLTRDGLRGALARDGARSGVSLGRRTVRAYHLRRDGGCALGALVTF